VNQYNMIERTIYYLSKMINKQLSKGDNYCKLNKTITINILDFDYINSKEFHSSFRFYENISNQLLTDKVEIRFIELKKFARIQKNYNDKLHRWLSFLINPKGKEIDILRKEDNEIKEVLDVLYQISGDSQTVILAELREKAIKDEVSRLQGAKDEGISEGASKLLIKQLTKKFGILSNEILESIKHLSLDSLEKIADDIFDITSLNDLKKYL
ncbi:MAG: Rpn family recombination-promoting nuclease/putative transposase, partial [Clostridium sp.]